MICYKCSQNIPDYSLVCPNCGAEMSKKAQMGSHMGSFGTPFGMPFSLPQSMMWYNLLIMFYLFIEAFYSVLSGIQNIIGILPAVLAESENLVTGFADINPSLRFVDIIYGFINIGFAVLAIIARNKLAKFKKDGPLFVILYFSVPTAINFIYTLVLFTCAGEGSAPYFTLVFQVIVQSAFVYANYIYFKKRKHLFIN